MLHLDSTFDLKFPKTNGEISFYLLSGCGNITMFSGQRCCYSFRQNVTKWNDFVTDSIIPLHLCRSLHGFQIMQISYRWFYIYRKCYGMSVCNKPLIRLWSDLVSAAALKGLNHGKLSFSMLKSHDS